MTGRLIVIDGTDGSGKKTQSKLLIKRLEENGFKAVYIDFPRHGHPHASLVDDYLNGKFGNAKDVNAYAASILYAADRFGASFTIRDFLKKDYIVICDRYVSANMGHQAGKIHDLKKRDEYLSWLEDLEFVKFGIPRADMNILLYVPTAINQQLVDMKDQRQYLGEKKRDIHENDREHLDDAASAFLYVAEKYDWPVIHCAPQGVLLHPEEIHELLWEKIQKTLILSIEK